MPYPKLSIITPVYNGERFMEFCIKNVIEQNCSEAEHIIIDGASTDKTVGIIKDYAKRYPHIRWISKKDKGQSDAMNKGIAMVRGKIIGILMVDDFYEPGVLNRVLEIFKTLPEPSFLVGNCNVWDNEGNHMHVTKPKKLNLIDMLAGNCLPNPTAYFYHTSLHQKIGPYKTDLYYTMCFDFELRAIQMANAKYIDEVWGNFRLLKGTKSFELSEKGQEISFRKPFIDTYKKNFSFLERLELAIKQLEFIIKRILYKILLKLYGRGLSSSGKKDTQRAKYS